ncbi:hypothetical protein U9M48_031293 [Paspalum notatum var. saurae]|uniref:Uncharacterized protein n=1 Tax=Paspalum notatum var. saurae TaxID=547442 RepID=A0AAQ3U2H7_PASNO
MAPRPRDAPAMLRRSCSRLLSAAPASAARRRSSGTPAPVLPLQYSRSRPPAPSSARLLRSHCGLRRSCSSLQRSLSRSPTPAFLLPASCSVVLLRLCLLNQNASLNVTRADLKLFFEHSICLKRRKLLQFSHTLCSYIHIWVLHELVEAKSALLLRFFIGKSKNCFTGL